MSAQRRWLGPALAVLLVLVLLTPLFAWAAGAVGYTEPLEHAAEATGAVDAAEPTPSPLPDYTVPGLTAPLGTLVSAFVGTCLTLLVALAGGRLLETPTES